GAAQLVDVSDAFPDVAGVGVERAGLLEQGEGAVEISSARQELALTGEDVLGADGRRLRVGVEGLAGVEHLGGGLEIAQVAQDAREVEEHLHLAAAAACAWLRS